MGVHWFAGSGVHFMHVSKADFFLLNRSGRKQNVPGPECFDDMRSNLL